MPFSSSYLHSRKRCLHVGGVGKRYSEVFSAIMMFSLQLIFCLHEADRIEVGHESLNVLHTPGHSPGSITLIGENCLFSGDTLFAGSIGRTDFPGSSDFQMNNSLKKLIGLASSLFVHPGHGPETTMGWKRS